jgi:hypothetical protein
MRDWMKTAPLVVSLLAGCSYLSHDQPKHPAAEESVAPSPAPVPSAIVPATPNRPADEPVAPTPPPVSQSKPAIAPKPSSAGVAKPKPPSSTAKPAQPSAPAAAAPVASGPKPDLDFKSLEQRLRDTSAIGVFTKLSIKNQVDDLLKAFRGYHAGQVPPSLDQLHQRYDGLLLKVVSLVQDDDASLAASISASRGAIWERLANKESFQAIKDS